MILVTGATGNVGREVVQALPSELVRAAVLNIPEARDILGDDIQYAEFDFAKPETFAPAFEGVKKMFLMRPPAISDVNTYIAPAVEAAKAAGVEQIVFLSIVGVEKNSFVPHHKIEKLLQESGVPWTMLRASFFMQNLSTTHRAEIREHDEIAVPVGDSRTSFIDVRDIGAVAGRVLTEDGHENRAYTLTGNEALTYYEIADILTDTLGRDIHYTHPSIFGFIRQQRTDGRPWGMTLVMTMLYTLTRLGMSAEVSHDAEDLLGRCPITFKQYARDHRSAWV